MLSCPTKLMGQKPWCDIPNFIEIGPSVPKKKVFKVFTMHGHGGHLGHVTWTIDTNFGSLFLRMLHMKYFDYNL